MKRIKGRRPSPALIVAGAALVIALAGTAVADPLAVTSVLNKKEKKQVKKIANGQIKKLAKGLSVATAANSAKLNGLNPNQLSPAAGATRTANLSLTNDNQVVMQTTITTAANSRLIASAAVHLDGTPPGDRADCQFFFNGVASTGYSSDITDDTTMPVNGHTTVGPGLHTVSLQCLENLGADIFVNNASMTVTAHLEG